MPAPGELRLQKTAEGTLSVALTGSWKLGQELPSADEVLHAFEDMPGIGIIAFDTRELSAESWGRPLKGDPRSCMLIFGWMMRGQG